MLNWPGRENLDEFDARVEDASLVNGAMPFPMMQFRRDIVVKHGGEDWFRKDKVLLLELLNGPYVTRRFMQVTQSMALEATEEVRRLSEAYLEHVKKFRGEVKNDIQSIRAAHDAVDRTVNQMAEVYRRTAALLTSPEFEQAIANAERLATALKAISELKSHNLTFAILDRKPAGD